MLLGYVLNLQTLTCIYVAESLCCSPETTATLLISHTPIQNVSNVKKKIKKPTDTHLEVRTTLICLWPNETVPADLSQSSNTSTLLSRSCFCVEAEPGLIRTLIRTLTALLHLGEIRGKQRGELFSFQCLFICLCRSYLSHAGSSVFAEALRPFSLSAVGRGVFS